MHCYPECSFWIPRALAKFSFVHIVLNRAKISIGTQKFGFINGVDNVNWQPYRDSKS